MEIGGSRLEAEASVNISTRSSQDRVEESVNISEAEKEAFSKAMKNVLRGEFVMPV
jgi:hypothetical protein